MELACTQAASFFSTRAWARRVASSSPAQVVITTRYLTADISASRRSATSISLPSSTICHLADLPARDADHARWEQAFSYDSHTWENNWAADFERADPATTCVGNRPKRQEPVFFLFFFFLCCFFLF